MPTPARTLTPGDTYLHGTTRLTVTARPYTVPGCLGDTVLRIPVRTHEGSEYNDVVYPDHEVEEAP